MTLNVCARGIGLLLVAASCGRTPAPEQTFPNEKAWSWQVTPRPASRGGQMIVNGVVVLLHDGEGDGVRVTTVCLDSSLKGVSQVRAVAFDSSLRRHLATSSGGASSSGVSMKSFLFPADSIAWESVRFVGIEELTEEHLRTLVVPEALRTLKAAGIRGLAYPAIGEPYSFELDAMDGSRVSSKVLTGKVVLLDFWASWCTPCMALLPELKTTYRTLKSRGFEVIGISLDSSREKAAEVTAKERLPWPVVLAPTRKEERELWETAAGITTIPRLWLIDRKGVLRADVWPSALKAEIEKLIAE